MGHELTVTLPPQPIYLDADPTRLAQVFGNLLNNACQVHGPGRSHLADRRAARASDVVVSVRDTGIGIAADQLPRIFEMFAQVDTSLERSRGGLGIGLTLVKRLVEMHGGTVEARSEGLGRGSEFVVRLPVAGRHAGAAGAGQPIDEPAAASRRRILIVDDNRDGAESLAMLLRLIGHETRTAHDGRRGGRGRRSGSGPTSCCSTSACRG